jgi:Skp family chaperone for outer membrane proteins
MLRREMLVLLGCLVLGVVSPGWAQTAGVRIGIVNTAQVFSDMAETKALMDKMSVERDNYMAQEKQRREEVKNIEGARDALRPDHPQYAEAENRYFEAVVKYEAWSKMVQARVQRDQKVQLKTLFAKIEAAVAEVAQQKNLDVVFTQHRPEIPAELDVISVDELRGRINQRNILYVNPKSAVDISTEVLNVLDRNYRGGATQ